MLSHAKKGVNLNKEIKVGGYEEISREKDN
jgi:hypothetical protein